MFAYCNNNPVNLCDSTGCAPKWFKKAVNWLNDSVIKPTKKFANKTRKAFTAENAYQELTNILANNTNATAGISLGFALQTTTGTWGIDFAQRMDIASVEFRDGKFDFGHSGKASFAFDIGKFSVGPKSDVFESSSDGARRVYEDTCFDICSSYGRAQVFLVGYQYEISISYLGIAKDLVNYINLF